VGNSQTLKETALIESFNLKVGKVRATGVHARSAGEGCLYSRVFECTVQQSHSGFRNQERFCSHTKDDACGARCSSNCL